jgi:UDP-2,4-diacetamido-2,4,6-trideoxy-beta-L-altropyranose hydrolase
MNKTVCIRVDGSVEIGTGHVIRCLALAEELSDRGYKPVFCTRGYDSGLIEKIKSRGFDLQVLHAALSMQEDMERFTEMGKKHNAGVVITDNYHFTDQYLKYLKENFKVVVSIDDIAESYFYSDILVNQNIYATPEMYNGKTATGTKLFLGTAYALLRPEFKAYHNQSREFSRVKNILVTLGGVDPDNQTLKVLKALDKIKADFSITAVIGVSNPHVEDISAFAESSEKPIKLLKNVNNMAELMHASDIAVSAAGSTSWELCCTGLPSIVIILADNQERIGKGLAEAGISINLGWFNDVTETMIQESVEKLINNAKLRESMGQKGKAAVDGSGAERIVDGIGVLRGRT